MTFGSAVKYSRALSRLGFKIKIAFVDKSASWDSEVSMARVAQHIVHHVGASITSSDNLQTAFVDGRFFRGQVDL